MCVCDLTHVADTIFPPLLDYTNKNLPSIDDIRATSRPVDASLVIAETAQGMVDSPKAFKANCWKREDWRSKFETVLQFLDDSLIDFILDNHHLWTPKNTQTISMISSSRILEELGSIALVAEKVQPSLSLFDMLPDTLVQLTDPNELSSSKEQEKVSYIFFHFRLPTEPTD